MGRVKFNINTEYAYIQNFKILQSETHTADFKSWLTLQQMLSRDTVSTA
jgi:hypothetical protein